MSPYPSPIAIRPTRSQSASEYQLSDSLTANCVIRIAEMEPLPCAGVGSMVCCCVWLAEELRLKLEMFGRSSSLSFG